MGSRERDQHAGLRKLDGVLETVVSRLGLRRDLDDYRIFEAWERVVGEQIARNAQPVRLDAKRLVVNVKNAVWMQELALLREDIRRRINEWMGRELVQDLFLVLGPPHDDEGSGAPQPRPRKR
jgi:predicted nucleic acid-binding Zn ribbon protein